MPKPKTKNKKKPAAKVGGGGVGTRVSKFNLKTVIPIVLVVAALGGFYIFQKSSASNATRLSGGQLYSKGAGQYYRLNTSDIYTTVYGSQYAGKSVCASGGAMKANRIEFGAYDERHVKIRVASGNFKQGSSFSLCFRLPGKDIIGNQKIKLKVSGSWKGVSVSGIQ